MPAIIKIQIDSASAGKGFDDTKKSLHDLGDSARKAGGGFDALTGMVAGATAAITGAVINMAAQGAAALAGFAKDSIDAAGTFEASVLGLQAVAGDALGQAGFSLDDVSAKALQLGKDTQFSAQEAIQAMTELAKGGVPIQSVMTDATDATLALAAAAGVDLPNAAEIVAKQLGVWAETGVSAAQVTDLLASAANASTVGVEDLALGLAQAGGTAKTAGVEFDEMVTTMAMIAPNFSSASDAGTSFKTFLSRLIPTTNPAKDAMMDLGLYTKETGSAFYDASGQFIGMQAAAELLQGATAGLTEEQRLLAFQTIFGADAIRAAAAIANAGAEGYNAMGASMEASGGAAAAAAVKQQGYAFAMEQMAGSIETFQIIVGSALLPSLTSIIGKITEVINIAMEFASGNYFTALTSLGSWLSENVNPALGSFVANLAIATDPMATFKQGIFDLLPGLETVWNFITGTAIPKLTELYNWISVNLPVGIALLSNFWQTTLLPALQTVWTFITGTAIPKLVELYDWIATNLPPVIATLSAFWETTLLPALQSVWAFITDTAIPKLTELYDWIATNLPPVIQTLSDTWTNVLLPALNDLWAFVTDNFLPLLQDVASFIAEEMKPGIEDLKQAFSMFSSFLSDNMKPALDVLLGVITNYPGPIKDLLSQVDGAKTAFSGWKGVVDNLRSAFNTLASAIRSLPTPPAWMGNTGGLAGGIGAGLGVQAGNSIAGRASGGPVSSGTPYMVGERGPELFVPSQSGNIVPNGATTNNTFNLTVNTSARTSSVISDFGMMKALAGVR